MAQYSLAFTDIWNKYRMFYDTKACRQNVRILETRNFNYSSRMLRNSDILRQLYIQKYHKILHCFLKNLVNTTNFSFLIFHRTNRINVACVLNHFLLPVISVLICTSTMDHGHSNVKSAREVSANKQTSEIIFFYTPVSFRFIRTFRIQKI